MGVGSRAGEPGGGAYGSHFMFHMVLVSRRWVSQAAAAAVPWEAPPGPALFPSTPTRCLPRHSCCFCRRPYARPPGQQESLSAGGRQRGHRRRSPAAPTLRALTPPLLPCARCRVWGGGGARAQVSWDEHRRGHDQWKAGVFDHTTKPPGGGGRTAPGTGCGRVGGRPRTAAAQAVLLEAYQNRKVRPLERRRKKGGEADGPASAPAQDLQTAAVARLLFSLPFSRVGCNRRTCATLCLCARVTTFSF